MKAEFKEQTKRILAKRAGERCSICKKGTSKPHSNINKAINLGEAAHIRGIKPGIVNTRYDPTMTDKERSHISNGIWLCSKCHKEIDTDEIKYNVKYLLKIKNNHEKDIELDKLDVNIIPEYKSLKKQIKILTAQIRDKEKLISKSQRIYEIEINKLIDELKSTFERKQKVEIQIRELKDQLSKLDFTSTSIVLKRAFEYYIKTKSIEETIRLLSEDDLKATEKQLADTRFFKARLYELKFDYKNAEANYLRGCEIHPVYENILKLINFYGFNKKFQKVIQISLQGLKNVKSPVQISLLYGYIGKSYDEIGKYNKALEYYNKSLKIYENFNEPLNTNDTLKIIRLVEGIAYSYVHLGQFNLALQEYQKELNMYFQLSIRNKKDYYKQVSGLYTHIAQLYNMCNMPDEAQKFLLRAIEHGKKFKKRSPHVFIALLINLSNTYLNFKIFDPQNAKLAVLKALSICKRNVERKPLIYMEPLILCYTKLGDIYIIEKKLTEAEKQYKNALKHAQKLYAINRIVFAGILANVHNNFGTLYKLKNQTEFSIKHLNLAIKHLNNPISYEDKKSFAIMLLNQADNYSKLNKNKSYMLASEAKNIFKKCKNFPDTFLYLQKAEKIIELTKDN